MSKKITIFYKDPDSRFKEFVKDLLECCNYWGAEKKIFVTDIEIL